MGKRRRNPPKPQARGRELWERQQAEIKRLSQSPLLREQLEQVRRLQDSPLIREQAKTIRRLHERLAPPREPLAKPPVRPATAKAKRRKPGAGAKQKLTTEEIARLQAAYRAAYCGAAKRKQSDVFDDLRELLGRHVGDSTLRYHVVRPLISAHRNKPAR
jgi:hypothetical protein